ncbi:TRMT11 family protein [Megaselia abdita]
MTKSWKKYILWFAQEHVEFRLAEINSLAKLFKLQLRILSSSNEELLRPFWTVELPDEESALKLASRSISLKCILEHWSDSNNFGDFHSSLKTYLKTNELSQQYFHKDLSFKITVETYNKHFSQKEKVQKIETFDYLPLKGDVNLKDPSVEWWYIEYYGLDPTKVPETPDAILFGRWIADGQRHLIKDLSLKKRKFIGNTSMDAQLSLLMANQALVQSGDIVLDPFVGTGSLLVSAAKFGGFVMGSDIDYMMVHAKCRPSRITQKTREADESIRANLKQYGCEKRYLDVLVSDFSNPIWRDSFKVNSIITDPPYGIREATEKICIKVSDKPDTRNEDSAHYPSTSHYSLQHLYLDLLTFSARHLVIGGRLVCWFPFHRDDYNDGMIPQHECLKLVSNSEQPLSGITSRRLLTYEKVEEYSEDAERSTKGEILEFRPRYFDSGLESRQERRTRRAQLREIGRLEAIKRGKVLDVKDGKYKKVIDE